MRPKFLTQPKLLFLILFAIGSLFQGFIFPTPVQAHECGSYGGLIVVADPISGTTKINISFNGIGGLSYDIRVYRNFGDNQNDEIYGPDEIEMGDEEVYRTTLDLAALNVNPKGELGKEYHVTVDGGYPGVCGDAAVILGSGASSTSGEMGCDTVAGSLERNSQSAFHDQGYRCGPVRDMT